MSTSKSTVLVVDDEADLREILAYTFERKGYNVLTAENGVEALKVIKKNKIHVIISDIRMPGGDGLQLLDEVKKLNPNIPIMLFVTGFSDVSFEEAFNKGVEAIFAKPFNTKVLLAAVEKMIQGLDDRWKDGRASERVPATSAIKLSFKNLEGATTTHVLNIGRGGFFVHMTDNFPQPEEFVNFQIAFENGPLTLIEGEGKVKWVRQKQNGDLMPGCGIEFIRLEEKSRAKVFELINFAKTQQYIPIG